MLFRFEYTVRAILSQNCTSRTFCPLAPSRRAVSYTHLDVYKRQVLAQCPKLRWVGIIATGTDNLDLKACRRHGVPVANVPGYSTYSVAQMKMCIRDSA